MGFPISKKLFGGLSINPRSSVGYNVYTTKTIDGTLTPYSSLYEGTGGLSEASGLLALKVSPYISLGAKAGYLWGNVAQTINQSVTIFSTSYTLIQEDNISYSGGYVNLVTQNQYPGNQESKLCFRRSSRTNHRLNSETSTTITKTYESSSEVMASDVKSNNSMKLPIDLGGGISFLYGPKWVASFDFKQSNGKCLAEHQSRKLSTNSSYRGGLEFAPKNDPSLFRNVARYRIGYRYDSGYLKLYNNEIHEQAVTFGVGLPIKKGRSYANVSFEVGSRGTKQSGLVKENFVKLNCSFSLWENWFSKRQYD
jgi:hypothetical protein